MARGLWLPSPPARRIITLGPEGLSAPLPADPHYNGIYTDAWWQTIRRVYAPIGLYVGNEERYTDAGKTIPANPADLVQVHGDLSGFGIDKTQPAAPNRPTATAAGLVYDGAASWMSLAGLASASNSYTIVSVVTPDTVAGTQTILGANAAAESFSHAVAGNVAFHDGAASRVGMVSLARKQLLSVRANAATGLVDFYRDGSRLGSAVYDNTFTWGANPVFGAAYGALAGFFDGTEEFSTVIPTALADADLAILHALLTMRYGTTFSALSVATLDLWYTFLAAYMTIVGGNVTQQADRSGLVRHALVPGGANAPAWNAVDLSVDYDNANTEAMQVATWGSVQPVTRIGFVQVSASNTLNHTCWDSAPLGNGCRLTKGAGAPGNIQIYAGAALSSADTAGNVWKRIAAVYNGANSTLRINNVLVAGPANAGGNAPGGLTMGRYGSLASPGDPRYKHHFAQYGRALSALEQAAIDTWIQLPPV